MAQNDLVELRQWMTQYRMIVARGEHSALITLLSDEPWPPDTLQSIGSALIPALVLRVNGSEEQVQRCIDALRERNWDGDRQLIQELTGSHDEGTEPLKPVNVDLDELASFLEGDPVNGGGRIDLKTGEVWPQQLLDDAGLEDEDDEAGEWLWFESLGSHDSYGDMEMFIEGIEDSGRADRLSIAIQGRGAFRRFGDVLSRWSGEIERWRQFSDERRLGRAREWLHREGYIPAPRAK